MKINVAKGDRAKDITKSKDLMHFLSCFEIIRKGNKMQINVVKGERARDIKRK